MGMDGIILFSALSKATKLFPHLENILLMVPLIAKLSLFRREFLLKLLFFSMEHGQNKSAFKLEILQEM